jgi:hypothetical protein
MSMKRLTGALAALLATVAFAAQAQADPSEYGIKSASASTSTSQAGGHPDFNTLLELKTVGEEGKQLPATTETTSVDLPAGLLGNPSAVPRCTAAQLVETDVEDPSNEAGCPQASQVGIITIKLKDAGAALALTEPIFNLQPRYGEPARFGFFAAFFPVLIDTELRPGHEYAATANVEVPPLIPLLSADTTLWGVPADEGHDDERITAYESAHGGVPETPSGKRSAGLVPVPLMRNPTRCGHAQGVNITATPYALPDLHSEAFAPLAPNTGCGLLEFKPSMSVQPTTAQAETGTGLNVELAFPTGGLEYPNLLGEADQKRVEVTLPEGVTVNPSEAEGLGVCSEADFAKETAASLPNVGCPETSKIGSASARSPLLEEQAEGSLYIAKPHANPFGTLIALYLVLRIPDRGVIVKLAGRVTPDSKTGQLTTTFGEAPYEIPQLPVSSLKLHFREGARSPLVTPPHCGRFESTATFTSWAGQVVTTHPTFEITRGPSGGPCPSGGLPPFKPGLTAGTLNNAAGAFSPFYLRLHRTDAEQEITHFSIKLPPGITGKLAGIPYCPDAAIAAAKARTGPLGGHEELAAPSCPAASEIGRTLAGAGVGPALTYAPGKVYLAGPYHGSKLSMVAITAGVVGPFDIGTVVVREAFQIDPETAEVFIDSTGSDPIPHIIQGIPVHLRDIRAYVDRPEFVLNPTDCTPTSTASTVLGAGLDFASEADDNPVTVSTPFQAADCAALPFKPKLTMRLRGGTRRGAHPAFSAHLAMNGIGEAAIDRAQVILPRSEFIENAHFKTICTRVQFKEGNGNGEKCPSGSVYGKAKAVTPILSEPLEGPVFLRSSEHQLPDLVIALHNSQVDFDLVGRVDSVKGGGLRNTFEATPDAPVTSFDLELEGGNKGLLVNSTDLCKAKHRAKADFTGQNGKAFSSRPVLRVKCKGKPQTSSASRGEDSKNKERPQ